MQQIASCWSIWRCIFERQFPDARAGSSMQMQFHCVYRHFTECICPRNIRIIAFHINFQDTWASALDIIVHKQLNGMHVNVQLSFNRSIAQSLNRCKHFNQFNRKFHIRIRFPAFIDPQIVPPPGWMHEMHLTIFTLTPQHFVKFTLNIHGPAKWQQQQPQPAPAEPSKCHCKNPWMLTYSFMQSHILGRVLDNCGRNRQLVIHVITAYPDT